MIVVHTTYHRDQEALSFLHTTRHRRPTIPTLERFALSQYIVDIGSPWRRKYIRSTDRVGFASSRVALVVRAKCPSSGPALPTLNRSCPRNTIHNTHLVSHMKVLHWLDSTRLDRSMMEVCFDILFIVHSSCWFADVEWVFVTCGCVVPFQVTNNNEVGLCCELLFPDQWIPMCVCACVVFLVTKTRCHMITTVLWPFLKLFQRLLTVVIEWYSSPSSDIWIVVEMWANKVGRSRVAANVLFVSVSLANRKRFQITHWLAWTDFVLLNRARNQYWSVQERLSYSGWNRIQHSVC